MGFGSRASLAAILGFAAAFVVACGSSGNGLLSSGQSSSIASQLTAISNAVQGNHCARATVASHRLTNLITDLPQSGVNQKLVANLGQGASTVQELAAKDCTTQSTSTPTVTVPTTTTQAVTTQTQTQTTTTTSATTTTPPTTNTTPPPTTATNGGGTGTSNSTTAAGGAPVGGATKTAGG
jgi:hypothetical protein